MLCSYLKGHRVSLLGAAFGVVAGGLPATTVNAQSNVDTAPARGPLEEVFVTARRVEEDLQRVPVAVTALSAAALEAAHVESIQQLNVLVPGLHVSGYSGRDAQVVSVRGQRNSQIQPGQDPAIGVYFNDVPTGFQFGMNLGMFDLANVQVLKGPQGTLFGRNSTGGAVLITSNRPSDILEGSVEVGAVGFDGGEGMTTTSVLNLPLTESLSARFALNTVNQDGWLENIADPAQVAANTGILPRAPAYRWPFGKTNFEPLSSEDSQTWRVSLDWRISDHIDNLLVYQGSNYETNGVVPSVTRTLTGAPLAATYEPVAARQRSIGDHWSVQPGTNDPITFDQDQVVDIFTVELGGVTLKNIAGWREFSRLWGNDAIGSPLDLPVSALLEYHQSGHEVSEEIQASGEAFDGKLDWIGGVFYFDNVMKQHLFGSAFGWNDRNTPEARAETLAAYAQGSYELPIEGLTFALGVRYTHDTRSMDKYQYGGTPTTCTLRISPAGPPVPPPNCYFYAKRSFDEVTYNATLSYQIDPAMMVYGSVARGYRAGGFNIAQSDLVGYEQGFKPESVMNYEVGLKGDWNIGNVGIRTNVAAYLQKYEDIVRQLQQVTGGAAFAVLTNGPKADITGAEVEFSVTPFDGLSVGLAYSYVDAEYTAPFYPIPTFNQQFNEFSLVPDTTMSANVSYQLPLDSAIGEVSVSANYYYQSRMWYDDASQGNSCGPSFNLPCGPFDYYTQKPYDTVSARLDWKGVAGSRFDVGLWGTNLTNTEYNVYGGSVVTTVGFLNMVGPPRFYGVDVQYSF
jgi:iron complex outermembrane receptor protein